jgi:hypothetical protein
MSAAGVPNAPAGGSGSAAGSPAGGAAGGQPVSGGSPAAGAGGSPTHGTPCGKPWVAGTTYAAGDIVQFQGRYFVAEHENPGYDPLISTYFWEPYTCGSDDGGGGAAPGGNSSFADIVSEQLFNQMFPNRNGFYTYQGLVDATREYEAFAGTGTDEQRRREAAAFLGNVARETGELVYVEQIEQGEYCASRPGCECEPGKRYFGRGPIQISWNYNYCAAGEVLGHNLRENPDLVAQNPTIAWATGLWFWMTQRGAGNYAPHVAIVEGRGFGETIRSINGSQECNGAWSEAVVARVAFYEKFCQILGVSPGGDLHC